MSTSSGGHLMGGIRLTKQVFERLRVRKETVNIGHYALSAITMGSPCSGKLMEGGNGTQPFVTLYRDIN